MDRDVGSNRKVTFLAVGMTGTGKSELCRWMTGNQALCTPSISTKSHTSEVIVVDGMPFNDPKLLSNIEWLDTPGRGDTRGYSKDSELWNQTVYQLRNREKPEHQCYRLGAQWGMAAWHSWPEVDATRAQTHIWHGAVQASTMLSLRVTSPIIIFNPFNNSRNFKPEPSTGICYALLC